MGNTLGLCAGLGLGLGVGATATAMMQAVGQNIEHLKTSSEAHANRVVTSQHEYIAEDIDESSAEGLYDAKRYATDNAMLVNVPVLGTDKRFWRLTDKATRISRKLAMILSSHHSVGKYLAAPLQLSNVWIGSTGTVKLRGVSFSSKGFSIHRVRDDYKHLSKVLIALIEISGGDITNLPPDYWDFLVLLGRGTITTRDEFLIVNNAALLPMENRTEVFLMLHDRIVNYLGRTNPSKRKKILSNLPYKRNWLDTARANAKINKRFQRVKNEYKRTQLDLLRLNRNVRCHMHEDSDDNIEEALYCEWPMLLMVMEKMLHFEGELEAEGIDIQNKFG